MAVSEQFSIKSWAYIDFGVQVCDGVTNPETVTLKYGGDPVQLIFKSGTGTQEDSTLRTGFVTRVRTANYNCLYPRFIDNPQSRNAFTHSKVTVKESVNLGQTLSINTGPTDTAELIEFWFEI